MGVAPISAGDVGTHSSELSQFQIHFKMLEFVTQDIARQTSGMPLLGSDAEAVLCLTKKLKYLAAPSGTGNGHAQSIPLPVGVAKQSNGSDDFGPMHEPLAV